LGAVHHQGDDGGVVIPRHLFVSGWSGWLWDAVYQKKTMTLFG
jgi:hypothetical protein